MNLFSNFCNICYKTNDGSLKEICQENMKHLKHTLYTFVGYADVINDNIIYLCQSCCEDLIRSNKFREMCFNNLIQLRQRVFDIKSKWELEHDDTCDVQNKLQIFLHEILQRNTLEKIHHPTSLPSKCHGNIKRCINLNKNEPVFKKQIKNLESERSGCEFTSGSNEISVINSEILRCSEGTALDFEGHSDKNVDVCNINNSTQFTKEEFDVKTETEIRTPEDFPPGHFENECGENVNVDGEGPGVNISEEIINSGIGSRKEEKLYIKQENSNSKDVELLTNQDDFGDGLNVAFEFVNVCSTVNMEGCGGKSIINEEISKFDMKLRGKRCSDKSSATNGRDNGKYPAPLAPGVFKRIYPDTEPSSCTVCNQTIRTSRPYTCFICNKTFRDLFNLTKHNRIHNGDRPYKCTICNKAFSQSSNLIRHKRIHTGDSPYKCTICNKTFIQSSDLTIHKRTHSGDRPYECTVCNKTFTKSYSLIKHKRAHNNDRPFICSVCNTNFTDSTALIRHTRTHSVDKPYKCTICNKAFADSSNFNVHLRTHSSV